MLKQSALAVATLVAAVALVSLFVLAPHGATDRLWAAEPQAQGRGMQGMPMNPTEMNAMHEKMMAEMKSSHARLDELVKKMNSSTGDPKVNAMAELLTEIVRQHRSMGDHMGMMHQHMMGQMK